MKTNESKHTPFYYVPPRGADGWHVARLLDRRLHTYNRVATTKTKAEAERLVAVLNAESGVQS
jgi:hypothetical protein